MKTILSFCLLFLCSHSILAQSFSVENLEIKSTLFKEPRKISVYLPPDYAEFPNRTYKVVYLFDASALGDHTKATFEYLNSNVNMVITPAIIVGIESVENRRYEFLPKNTTLNPSGGADLLAESLQNEIIPAIKNKYRCSDYSLAIGHSLGGSFVTYAMVKYPNLFQAGIVISPNFEYGNGQFLETFETLATLKTLDNKFLYIAYGNGDRTEDLFRPATQKLEKILQQKNIPGLRWQVKSLDNDSHGATAIEGIFKGWMAFNKDLAVSNDVIMEQQAKAPVTDYLKEQYKILSDKTGIKLPSIEDFNIIAYNRLYTNKQQEAIAIGKWALSMYPDDSNLYDSVGEFEQEVKNFAEARRYYSEGLQVVEKEKKRLSPEIYNKKTKSFKERLNSLPK